MAAPVPVLGFICPDCHHGMTPVCSACEKRRQEADEAAWFNQHQRDEDRKREEREEREERRKILGVTELEERFETDLRVEEDADEDGATGYWTASIFLPGFEVDSGGGTSAEAAVADLRVEIAKELRATANEMELGSDEPGWCLSLDEAQVRTLLRALSRQHGDPELGKATAALTEVLCRQTGMGRDG